MSEEDIVSEEEMARASGQLAKSLKSLDSQEEVLCSVEELYSLAKAASMYHSLMAAGVEDWEGYEDALEVHELAIQHKEVDE